MDFFKDRKEVIILTPPGFSMETHIVELRKDPLTGFVCRINSNRSKRPMQVQPASSISDFTTTSSECPFCPEKIDTATPRFPSHIISSGYYQSGQVRLFPNLYPLAEYHAVITLSREHFIPLERFRSEAIADGISAAINFLSSLSTLSPSVIYPVLIWNHLPPSAASIVHPHMQLLVDTRPTWYQEQILNAGMEYYSKNKSCYWDDLIGHERSSGERFVAENDSLCIIASYAPQGNREFQIISKSVSSMVDMDKKQVNDLAVAVSTILKVYHKSGVESFNMTTMSSGVGVESEFYRLNVKLIARPAARHIYRNDTGVLERVHFETDLEIEPETLAQHAREYF
ncbi:MAG: hypothetical protein U1D67_01065 [Dehalococcoidia bacterium]|nr:hypothetical protein [Dehalococcoidia bacterium]MDZ4245688.1 hypothetical protein [Dehalococcoidia bacterium]